MLQLVVNRNVSKTELKWLKRDLQKGETVYLHAGFDECTSENGLPCSFTGKLPYFELTSLMLSLRHEGILYRIFQTERMGALYDIFAMSENGDTIKITTFKGRILIEKIPASEILRSVFYFLLPLLGISQKTNAFV